VPDLPEQDQQKKFDPTQRGYFGLPEGIPYPLSYEEAYGPVRELTDRPHEEKNPNLEQLRANAMALPQSPGVYIMKNAAGTIIYIGKAKALKNRVSSYFGSDARHESRVRQMVSQVDHFEYIIADSEFEALVLECSLIKQYTPKYNMKLKDDKGYHYIRVTPPPFPRIYSTPQKSDDGATYIGPYVSSFSVKNSVDEANRLFQLATCTRKFSIVNSQLSIKYRPCLNHHIGQCCAPCAGRIGEAAYMERHDKALAFLTRGSAAVIAEMQQQMETAAEKLDFERAASLRDTISAFHKLQAKQKVVMSKISEQDIIALARSAAAAESNACFEVFRFSGGNLFDREHFFVDIDTATETLPAARAEFLRRYYTMRAPVPPQITVDGDVEDTGLLERWLGEKAGRRVRIVQPQIGEQAQLIEMCRANAAERLAQQAGTSSTRGAAGHQLAALNELARLLGLPAPPGYIECYDISHTAGADPVAGMVVFEQGKPLKAGYRKFNIKSADAADDYGAMREVLQRRLEEYRGSCGCGRDIASSLSEAGSELPTSTPYGFKRLPDLILLDGGAGHVSAVKPLVDSYGLDIPVFGLVKDDRHRTRAIAADGGEIAIQSKRTAFTLLSAIQEEVHRYAVSFHRQKRKKNTLVTALTDIPGIGAGRANALLKAFGSLKAIKGASVEQLLSVKGIPRSAAEGILKYFEEDG